MSGERFDFVVYGASGFTGEYVVEEMTRIYKQENISWAVAGRSEAKVRKALELASKHTGEDLSGVTIIVADCQDEDSLNRMCQRTRVVLNCVGPYRFYGEPVVKACVENGANHVDISGEPQYLESMQLKYHEAAKRAGVYIIGACGFDSIPAEMGIQFCKQNMEGDLNSVENFLQIYPGPEGLVGNSATYVSAIHGIANWKSLISLRKKLFPTAPPKYKHKLIKRSPVSVSEEVGKYVLQNSFADKPVVYRTQRFLHDVKKQRPVQFQAYIAIPGIAFLVAAMFFGVVFLILSMFKSGRSLLEKYPRLFTCGLFSHEGPTRKQVEGTSFSMLFIGKGYDKKLPLHQDHDQPPTRMVKALVSGPEAGYITTPICMTQSALLVLKERNKLPSKGGVYAPGAAFAETNLIDRLSARQVKFQLVA